MSNFLAALQQVAPSTAVPKATIKPRIPAVPVAAPPPLEVTVDRVIGRNRIDVTFNRKPDEVTLDALKRNGFRYNPESRAWYHKDCAQTREVLSALFDADFTEVLCGDESDKADDLLAVETPVIPETVSTVGASPEFVKYREQVNQLIERLQIEPADLILVAIDCLYRKTFEN